MKTKFTQSVLMLFLVVGLFVVGAGRAEALSGSIPWNSGNMGNVLFYFWNLGGNGGGGWARGLSDWNVTIHYNAQVQNNGLPLSGNTVAVGDSIAFGFIPHQDTDISWFGSGYSLDSPFGHWLSGATAPSTAWGDFVNRVILVPPSFFVFDIYIPLSVNPPTITYDHVGSTAGLSCDGTGQTCTVTSPGSIIGHVNFSSTYGKFYYMYQTVATGDWVYNQIAMKEGFGVCGPVACTGGLDSSSYTLTVPAQTITFNLTAVSNNNRPLPPSLTVDAPSKNVNTDFVFTATSTDPDGDTLKYGFDWNNDTIIDQWVPASLFVASGTPQTANYQWPTAGTYTVRAVAMDSNGGQSDPSAPLSVTVNALPPNPIINSFTINGSTGSVNLLRGDMRNIAWTVSNAVSCSASSGDVWSGNKAVPTGTDLNLPANVTTPHTLDCMNVLGIHTSSTIQVNVSCTPSTGTFGSCACATETKTRTNTSALCISVIESTSCDVDEKKACRNFNWTEGSP